MERYYIGKIGISAIDLKEAVRFVNDTVKNKKTGYICVTNSRTAHLSNVDDSYCKIQNQSLLTVADGVPLKWIAHRKGYKNVGRVCGPDLFLALLNESADKKYSHFFYGSSEDTINKINRKMKTEYPQIEVKGSISPPFQPIENYNIDELAELINRLQPTFFWCGLGAPKQEQLMALLQPKLHSTICIGVGLVFEYFAGTVERAPEWAQKNGLEGIYRLSQQPRKIGRIIRPFSWIIGQYVKSLFLK